MPKAGQFLKTTIIGFCGPWAQGLGPKGPGKGGPEEGPAEPRRISEKGPGRPREGPLRAQGEQEGPEGPRGGAGRSFNLTR